VVRSQQAGQKGSRAIYPCNGVKRMPHDVVIEYWRSLDSVV